MTEPKQDVQPKPDIAQSAVSTGSAPTQGTQQTAVVKVPHADASMSDTTTSQVVMTPKDNPEGLSAYCGKDEKLTSSESVEGKEKDLKMHDEVVRDTNASKDDEPQTTNMWAASGVSLKSDVMNGVAEKCEDTKMEDTKPPAADATMDTELIIPDLNSEIEVLWELEDEKGEKEDVWWKARVQGTERRPREDGVDEVIHILLYDSYEGFEEEVVKVKFRAGRELIDLSRTDEEGGGVLPWRFVGACMDDDKIEISTEIFKGMVFQSAAERMSKLPADKQHLVADKVANFTQHVEDGLKRILQERGAAHVVSREEVMDIFNKLPLNKQNQ